VSNVHGAESLSYLKMMERKYILVKYFSISNTPANTPANPEKHMGHGSSVNTATISCTNADFELTPPGTYTSANAVLEWSVSSRTVNSCGPGMSWSPGSNEFAILATPIMSIPGIGTLTHSPLGGSNVARLNNYMQNYHSTRLSYSIAVTSSNYLVDFAFAGVWQDGSHLCCEQPYFTVDLSDVSGNQLSCYGYTAIPVGSQCPNSTPGFVVAGGLVYTGWKQQTLNLSVYIGMTVWLNFITSDCIYGGHYGSSFIDFKCPQDNCEAMMEYDNQLRYCAGSNVAQLTALQIPNTSYYWIAPAGSPPISPSQASLTAITVTNPIPGAMYTLALTSSSGCYYMRTITISPSTINIGCLNATAACPESATGAATIHVSGSSVGYNYSWISLTTSLTVGSSSVVNNLPPGNYSLVVSAPGATACGIATATLTIDTVLNQTPPLSLSTSSQVVCAGATVTLTASGAGFYHWLLGPSTPTFAVSPLLTTVYTATGTSSGMACQSVKNITVSVVIPSVTVAPNPPSVCAGYPVILTASGATSYTWSTSATTPTCMILPITTSIYTVTANTFSNWINCPSTHTVQVNVNPKPAVYAISLYKNICVGQTAVLSTGGAVSFLWSTGSTSTSINECPTVTGTYVYTVTGTDANGCMNTATIQLQVSKCEGLEEDFSQDNITVFPNPSDGEFIVKGNSSQEFLLLDTQGRVIKTVTLDIYNNYTAKVNGIASGLYFLRNSQHTIKLVIDH
jgi:hypothetical protein